MAYATAAQEALRTGDVLFVSCAFIISCPHQLGDDAANQLPPKRQRDLTYDENAAAFKRSCAKLLSDFWFQFKNSSEMQKIREVQTAMFQEIIAIQAQKEELLRRKRGGGGKGKRIVMRKFEIAFQTLIEQYFSLQPPPLYSISQFKRRFRVSKALFQRIYCALAQHPLFQQRRNAARRWGIHPLVKTTAVFRHLAYGVPADMLDDHYQLAETTFLETRHAFCKVGSV